MSFELESVYKLSLDQDRHSGESRNPVLSRRSGCRISIESSLNDKSGMTENVVYGQTLIINDHFDLRAFNSSFSTQNS